jgi:hypothetical protein
MMAPSRPVLKKQAVGDAEDVLIAMPTDTFIDWCLT